MNVFGRVESIVGDSEFKRSLRPEAGESSDVKSAATAQETSVAAIW